MHSVLVPPPPKKNVCANKKFVVINSCKNVVNSDLEFGSSGRLHIAFQLLFIRPDLGIMIYHCCRISIVTLSDSCQKCETHF